MTYSLERINPIPANAAAMLDMIAADLINEGMPEGRVQAFADANNAEHVQRQIERLRQNPERYMGAVARDQVVGFTKANEHFTGDQRPYAGPLEQVRLRVYDRLNGHHLPGRPLGIFALNVAASLDENEQLAIANQLVEGVLTYEAAGHGDVRVGLSDNDPLRPLFLDRGFKSTGKYGNPLGPRLQLHVRPVEK